MAKKRRKLKTANKEEKIKKTEDPNPDSENFIYDEVDKFHRSKDKILLDKTRDDESSENEIDDEEILALNDESDDDEDDEEEDDDSMEGSDEEEDVEDNDLSNDDDILEKVEDDIDDDKAWGKRKKDFYDADVHDDDIYDSDEEAEAAALEEEKEAMTLQKRMAEKLDADDFYKVDKSITIQSDEKVIKEVLPTDLSKLTKKEKLELLSKESPELLPLLSEYMQRIDEIKQKYNPLLQMTKHNLIEDETVVKFIEMKHHLLLNYLVNISFYLALKASKDNIQGHPIFNKLVQHRELLEQMEELDESMLGKFEDMLEKFKAGEIDISEVKSKSMTENIKAYELKKSTKHKEKNNEKKNIVEKKTLDEDDFTVSPLDWYNMVKSRKAALKRKRKESEEEGVEDILDENISEEEKRQITYEMSKNKGLIRKRRKELKNPRIKHRVKFRKAKIKHKGQVPEVTRQNSRYGGELTGIKSNISRSVKIKS